MNRPAGHIRVREFVHSGRWLVFHAPGGDVFGRAHSITVSYGWEGLRAVCEFVTEKGSRLNLKGNELELLEPVFADPA